MLGIFNSNVTTKFVLLHHHLSQNIGGTKDIESPFVQKWGACPPPPESQSLIIIIINNPFLRSSFGYESWQCARERELKSKWKARIGMPKLLKNCTCERQNSIRKTASLRKVNPEWLDRKTNFNVLRIHRTLWPGSMFLCWCRSEQKHRNPKKG